MTTEALRKQRTQSDMSDPIPPSKHAAQGFSVFSVPSVPQWFEKLACGSMSVFGLNHPQRDRLRVSIPPIQNRHSEISPRKKRKPQPHRTAPFSPTASQFLQSAIINPQSSIPSPKRGIRISPIPLPHENPQNFRKPNQNPPHFLRFPRNKSVPSRPLKPSQIPHHQSLASSPPAPSDARFPLRNIFSYSVQNFLADCPICRFPVIEIYESAEVPCPLTPAPLLFFRSPGANITSTTEKKHNPLKKPKSPILS